MRDGDETPTLAGWRICVVVVAALFLLWRTWRWMFTGL